MEKYRFHKSIVAGKSRENTPLFISTSKIHTKIYKITTVNSNSGLVTFLKAKSNP
jgi:hypothetical protein